MYNILDIHIQIKRSSQCAQLHLSQLLLLYISKKNGKQKSYENVR